MSVVGSGRRSVFVAGLVGLLALLAAGCTGNIADPDGWSAPVLVDGLVLVQERPGELVALSLGDDGSSRVAWRFPEDAGLPAGLDPDDIDLEALYATPIVDGDDVYLAAYSGDVLAFSVESGTPRVRWLRRLSNHIVATPAYDAAGGMLYVATEAGQLVAVETGNGALGDPLALASERLWAQPALGAGTVYVGGLDEWVRAIDRSTLAERWSHRIGGAIAGDPIIDGDTLYVGAMDRAIYALDVLAEGAELWRFPGDGWFWARPLLVGETLYAATANGTVYALDARSGDELWHFGEEDSEVRGQPVLADGVLVLALRSGAVFGVDPATGDRLWREDLLDGELLADPLVLESGILYSTDNGDLVKVDPLSGAMTFVFERG
ncbi:MAG: PQQ-binding-like beta-propeller repeat protein [Chloroflexi bacterium]|nr:PQQ-binding-like beta-propeller repeat protein [Chloroflexota bacterium]